jgi:hypothetical protein
MKVRDPKDRKIKMIYTRCFYKQCIICHLEFRQTNMWSWIGYWDWEGYPQKVHACTSCIPDYQDLLHHIENQDKIISIKKANRRKPDK